VNGFRLGFVGLALLSGCKSNPRADAGAVAQVAAEAEAPKGWALTPAMLDGYVGYQEALLVQFGKATPPKWDGGLKVFEDPGIEAKADADELARKRAGLTADDVVQIEAMVARVASRRMTYRLLGGDQPPLSPGDPEQLANQPEVAQAVAMQEKLQKETQALREEREEFGNQNIDVLLTREGPLLKNWALMMGVPELAESRPR